MKSEKDSNKSYLGIVKTKEKPIFTSYGILLIFFVLFLGVVFVYQDKKSKFDNYFAEKYLPDYRNQIFHKTYRIGFVSDAHAKFSNKALDIRLESRTPMSNFISEMNTNFRPDFVVDGGDFIDGSKRFGEKSMQDYAVFSKIFDSIQAPKYRVIGNHELRGMTKENWVQLNNYADSYYYFDLEKLRVIVLDSTLISGSRDDDPVKASEYEKQYVWLEDVLKNSDEYQKIIFTHYPFIPLLRKAMPIQEIEKFNNLVSEYKVKAVFSGHVEVPFYEKIEGVDYFVIPGFFRSEANGLAWRDCFSEITFGIRSKLKLFYKKEGDQEYRTVVMPSREFNEMEKNIMSTVNFLAPTD